MTRKLLFRAWNKTVKKMLQNVCIDHQGGVMWDYLGDELNCIPMQFTGLLDKNGKEIYEGDIVRLTYWESDSGWYTKTPIESGIVYFDTYWGVKFDCQDKSQRTAEYWKSIDERDLGGANLGEKKDIEIIGNIYEDEHLLSNQSKND